MRTLPGRSRSATPSRVSLALASALALALVSCGGPSGPPGPPPDEGFEVSGTIALPPGHGVDLDTLRVVTPFGSFQVEADGTFTAEVSEDFVTELGVETADGALLLLGVTQGDTATVSLTSTAEALLYYLAGGMWLPAENQARLRAELRGREEAQPLAAELQRLLSAGGNGLAEADDDLIAAIEAAHASLFADVEFANPDAWLGLVPDAAANTVNNVLVQPTSRQAGAFLLHNQEGGGVVVLNELRRRATLLAYEVGWENVDREWQDVDPPVLAGSIEVPATGQLEFFNALYDVVTRDAPWAPVLSEPLGLPMRSGAFRSHYELVLLGPSIWAGTPAIMDDPRFASFQDEWQEIIGDRAVDLFLDELLLPLIEVYTLGWTAKFSAAKLREMRAHVRTIYDNHLLGLGVYIRQGPSGYAQGMRFVLEELAHNGTLRSDMINMVTEALEQSQRSRVSVENVERRLATRASAAAIAAAVQTVLVGGDVAKILYDLTGTPPAASWQAEVSAARFVLQPGGTATIGRTIAHDVRISVHAVGDVQGNFLFRWTTTGKHGTIYNFLGEEGLGFDTWHNEVLYQHKDPLNIMSWHVDTVTVEVFELDAGVTEIPDGTEAVARLSIVIKGEDCEVPTCSEYNGNLICFCDG